MIELISDFEKLLEEAIKSEIVKFFKTQFIDITDKAREIFKRKIEEHPTFISLITDGDLIPELGLPFTIRKWISTSFADEIVAGLKVEFINSAQALDVKITWDNLVSKSSYAQYNSYSRNPQGGTKKTIIPWLEWLLEEGTNIVVGNYHIVYGTNLASSRTGRAVMKQGGTWSMPPQFAGTNQDNFITQALAQAIPEILA